MIRFALYFACLCIAGPVGTGTAMAAPAEEGWRQVAQPVHTMVPREEAKRVALERVPGGKVMRAKLEIEGDMLLWSVDVKMPDSRNFTEIHIDARTGNIVSVEIETPEQRAAELAADKRRIK